MDIVVCEGDETGQELLVEALRVLDPELLGIPIALHRFDLSLDNRRSTENAVVIEAADAMLKVGFGLKAATITPVGAEDVGSPNRLLREAVGGSVIVRSGRRIPGVTARSIGARVYGGPKWTVSPVYEGMLKEELDSAAERYPAVPYRPTLIDAAYAGFINEASEAPIVMPTLNRDGDCLSDLVLALFGSIAGAESVLLALDAELCPAVVMAEAPTGPPRHSWARTSRTPWRWSSRVRQYSITRDAQATGATSQARPA